jgi:prephenate dehydrogenase
MRSMQRVLVVGLGEVGRPLFDLVRESGRYQVAGVDKVASRAGAVKGDFPVSGAVDVLLLCYPCGKQADYVKAAVA